MSGHSKWHEIRRKKGVLDQRRGQRWTKLARDVTIAAREGGGDVGTNFRLRLAIEKAKGDNMPSDNIQRAIDRGLGITGEASLDEINYEGYGPGGVAIIVESATDNRNRTVSEVRTAFNKNGGTLGEAGSVGWMFDLKGMITVDRTADLDPDEVTMLAIEADADDIIVNLDNIIIYTGFSRLAAVRDQLNESGVKLSSAEKVMQPKAIVTIEEKETFQALRLLEKLEDLDDVQKVYSNLDVSDELAERYAEQG
ncbi:MAG: YebC/PmpR family DNA-binding transcriptional regulator [Herpetosiphonaceae bacterium]|nr:YebC/PmpR family DNA-binding transcriptional regulator [Herpetosiphonaceae bacterium]